MKKIFITGGGGYVGSVLVPKLLKNDFKVTVLDLFIYGNNVLNGHPNLKLIKGDIRDTELLNREIKNHDTVIHLACISNDPSFELNPTLGKSINLNAFEPLVTISKKNNVNNFIYASSSSVYGLKSEDNVSEDMILEPLTDYSKFKADCESILLKHDSANFITTIIRPATVCGYGKRQRLDVVVNILTTYAYYNRQISVFGGSQLRPNIHIEDMCNSYLAVLNAPNDKIKGQVFNVGYDNFKVIEIANQVKQVMGDDVTLNVVPTDDNRSYHISSQKIYNDLGFSPSKSIIDAVTDLKCSFEKKLLSDPLNNILYYNIKMMKKINLK